MRNALVTAFFLSMGRKREEKKKPPLTERKRVRLEKLAVAQLIKKFFSFCATRRHINVFTGWSHEALLS
jgi:hypothetical protein